MPTARASHSSYVVTGKLYIVGDRVGDHVLNSAVRLDVTTGTWRTLSAMSTARAPHSASVIAGKLYMRAVGHDGNQALNSAVRFDFVTVTW